MDAELEQLDDGQLALEGDAPPTAELGRELAPTGGYVFASRVRRKAVRTCESAAESAVLSAVSVPSLVSSTCSISATGVSARVHARIVESTGKIDTLAQHERDLEKALEVVRETRKKLEHDREHDIGLIVDVVKSTAQRTGDTALLAAFEQTIRYKNQIPAKVAQTRRKNADARDEVEAPADDENT